VLQELPAMTVEQRQLLIRRALEFDDHALTPEDEAVVEERQTAHRHDAASAVPREAMKVRLRSRFPK